jgi:hypothetical protein
VPAAGRIRRWSNSTPSAASRSSFGVIQSNSLKPKAKSAMPSRPNTATARSDIPNVSKFHCSANSVMVVSG